MDTLNYTIILEEFNYLKSMKCQKFSILRTELSETDIDARVSWL